MTARPAARLTIAAVILALLSTSAQAERPRSDPEPTSLRASRPLAVRGHMRGLYPGARSGMSVVVRNLTRAPVEVHRIVARVGAAGPGCAARNLILRRFRGTRVVPPHGVVRVQLQVRLRQTAPDACQGVRFPLTFRAKGSPA